MKRSTFSKNQTIYFLKSFFAFSVLLLSAIILLMGCKNKETNEEATSIAVFIPGVMAGSPIYEMLADGAKKAAEDFAASSIDAIPLVTVIEGGFNQAEWESQVTTLAASGNYDLIVSSNPSLPVIVSSVSEKFPGQKFLLLDGELTGNPNVYSLRYNQREQAYMAGYLAALATLEATDFEPAAVTGGEPSLADARPAPAAGVKRIGLVAAQEYPVMNNVILPGYTEGALAVDSGFSVDFRVVGNWFDAAKAAELAAGMIRGGIKVLLPIAGGAGAGVVQAASETGAKVIWFDTSGYAIRPGTVIGSAILRQDKAAYEKIMLYLKGSLPFGKAEIAGIKNGFVDFIEDDPLYISAVSRTIREKQAALLARLRSGELRLD